MFMELEDRISELSLLDAPSGFEDAAAERITDMLRPFVDEVRRDAIGNVIAVKRCGNPEAEKILLDAHMDEVGFIITGSEEGFLKFSLLGSIDPRNLIGCEVTVLTKDPIFGVIACLPPHVLKKDEREKVIAVKDLYIDIGQSLDNADAVPVGTAGVFRGAVTRLNGNYLCAKALDNRLCVAVMLDAVSKLYNERINADLYIIASVQEELGTRGAVTGAFGISPDYCVAIDVTHAETPDSPKTGVFKAGKGPAIGVGPNMNRAFSQKLIDICKRNQIPYQIEVMAGSSGTDAWPIQVSREGVCTAVLSVPLK
jgi:endoglucanase